MKKYKHSPEKSIIKKLNREYFDKSANDFDKTAVVWSSGDFTHVCFNSPGCSMRRNGSCIMCNYGKGHAVDVYEVEEFLDDFIKETKTSEVLFGTCGSIFDTGEISEDVLELICRSSNRLKAKSIIFETHCNTVNDDVLNRVHNWIRDDDKEISIEMGFETSNEYILNEILCKNLNLKQLEKAIVIIHKNKMKVILNVLFGSPFLSEEEQIEDVINSILWAEKRSVDRIVIFPLNIKKNTYLYELYKRNKYNPVSHRQILKLLKRIYSLDNKGDIYDTLELSWYGNRQNENDLSSVIPPDMECFDNDKIMDFYESFLSASNRAEKKKLLEIFLTE